MSDQKKKMKMLWELDKLYQEGYSRRKHLTAHSDSEEIEFELKLVQCQKEKSHEREVKADLWAACLLGLVTLTRPTQETSEKNDCHK